MAKQQSKSTNGNQEDSGKRTPGKTLPIEYVYPEGQRALYSNYATVQREGGRNFHLSFFEIRPPILVGTEEERKEQLSLLDSVQAHCLTRIVVSTERAEGLIGALLDQLAKSKKESTGLSKTDKEDVVPGEKINE